MLPAQLMQTSTLTEGRLANARVVSGPAPNSLSPLLGDQVWLLARRPSRLPISHWMQMILTRVSKSSWGLVAAMPFNLITSDWLCDTTQLVPSPTDRAEGSV